ncbi:MAG: hypothetical protein HPY53_01405 [Brevinematales bacterium]|nr:hypothetical protein [Brevinematales bacterium]
MKEHCITCSTDKLKATLKGLMRILFVPIKGHQYLNWIAPHPGGGWYGMDTDEILPPVSNKGFACPYGVSEDSLWVQETWAEEEAQNLEGDYSGHIYFKADEGIYMGNYDGIDIYNYAPVKKWRSPILMPREYSRITLEIANIQAVKIQNISDQDARLSGSYGYELPESERSFNRGYTNPYRYEKERFAYFWDSYNKVEYQWKKNPWAWRICVVPYRKGVEIPLKIAA